MADHASVAVAIAEPESAMLSGQRPRVFARPPARCALASLGNCQELVNVRLEHNLRPAIALPTGRGVVGCYGVDLPVSRCRKRLGRDACFDQEMHDDGPSPGRPQRLRDVARKRCLQCFRQ